MEQRTKNITMLLALPDPLRPALGSAEWQALRLLRLEEGDAGHALWARARARFVRLLAESLATWVREDRRDGDGRAAADLCVLPGIGPYGGQQ